MAVGKCQPGKMVGLPCMIYLPTGDFVRANVGNMEHMGHTKCWVGINMYQPSRFDNDILGFSANDILYRIDIINEEPQEY